jgi:hypothetical protein
MKTIIYPIFPSAIDEGNFLSILIRKKAPLLAAGRTMMGKKGWRAIVCTNNQTISNYAEELGLQIVRMEEEVPLKPGPLPTGALHAIEYCQRGGRLIGGVVLLDYRNLGVNHVEVEKAMTKAESDNSILVSILKPRDHPVQFDIPMERAFTETHMSPDASFLDRLEIRLPVRAVASFPFFFNWEQCGIHPVFGKNVAYIQKKSGLDLFCEPADLETLAPGCDDIWLWQDSPNSARRLFAAEDIRLMGADTPTFLPFYQHLKEAALLIQPDGKNKYNIYGQLDPQETYHISTYGISNGVIDGQPCDERWVMPEGCFPHQKMIATDNGVFRQVAFFQKQAVDGFFLVVLRAGHGVHATHFLPFLLENGGWEINAKTGQRILSNNGPSVSGRQDFPSVYEVDGALAAMTQDRISDFYRFPECPGIHGIELCRESRVKVRSEIDLLRLR